MTRLRPIVVPIAALTLATAAPSANAHQRRPVIDTWATSPPSLAAVHADLPPSAAAVQPATSPLPLADLAPPGEAAVPDGRYAVPAPPAAVAAAGRPTPYTARGPP
jgi:hypothetical protein